jgi:hypothetical protein
MNARLPRHSAVTLLAAWFGAAFVGALAGVAGFLILTLGVLT